MTMFCASASETSNFPAALVLDALAIDGGPAAGQFPVGAGGEIFQRLDAILGQRLDHLGCQALEFNQAVLDAQFAGMVQRRLGLRFEVSRARACNSSAVSPSTPSITSNSSRST